MKNIYLLLITLILACQNLLAQNTAYESGKKFDKIVYILIIVSCIFNESFEKEKIKTCRKKYLTLL